MGYDARKAALYNKLIKDGVSEDAALAQAGITDSDFGNYAIGTNGEMGSLIVGTGTRPDVEIVTSRNQPSRVSYDQDPSGRPTQQPTQKNVTYTTTSTETVSGGGSTTIVAGPRQSNATSQALGNAYDAKNAEYNQFVKDNPSDFARRRQGLPPLTPEQAQQRQQQLDTLNREKEALKNQQIDAETPGAPTVINTPNTTTTTTTVTSGRSSSNQQLNIQDDPAVFQQAETQLDNTTSVATATTARSPDLVDAEDDPFEAERLRREQEFDNDPPTLTAEDVGEEDPFEARRLELEQELNREELAASNFNPEPVDIDNDPAVRAFEESSRAEAEERLNELYSPENESALRASLEQSARQRAREQATLNARYRTSANNDWRVRVSLAPQSQYLYNSDSPGILRPLAATKGVIFPYTPTVTTVYTANYDAYDLIHSNYRGLYYKNSRVGDVSVRGMFTAQDTAEAEYLLAVIHFFRSVTKMFYGQDPERGTPPPLVYLSGFGEFQFNGHPCVVSNFNYTLPNDVDYIKANNPNNYGTNLVNRRQPTESGSGGTGFAGARRLANALLTKGAQPAVPSPRGITQSVNNTMDSTYVPTKMEIDITLIPVQTRNQVSKVFSLKDFANGNGLKGGFW